MEKLYTSTEVGRLIGRTSVAVRIQAARKGIGQKVGNGWVFTAEDIERLRAINPLGGRPTRDGGPIQYQADTANIRKRGPKRRPNG